MRNAGLCPKPQAHGRQGTRHKPQPTHLERVVLQYPLLQVDRQELANVVAAVAEGHLGQVVGAKGEELGRGRNGASLKAGQGRQGGQAGQQGKGRHGVRTRGGG